MKPNMYAAILIYLVLFVGVSMWWKPAWLVNPDGSFREMGVGTRNKTIFPLALFSLCLAVLCYLGTFG